MPLSPNNWKHRVMSTILPFKTLYQPDASRDLFWRCFEKAEGLKTLSKGYLAHRIEDFLLRKIVLAERVQKEGFPQEHTLVFVNGFFAKELSSFPEGVLLTFAEASQIYGSFIENRQKKTVAGEKGALAALNGAFAQGPAFLYVPPGIVVEKVVRVVQVTTSKAEEEKVALCSPRLQIVVGRQSQLKIMIEQETSSSHCVNQALDIQLEEGAHLEFVTLFAGSDEGFLFDNLRATLKENSFLSGHIVSRGARACVRDYHVELIGEGAKAKIKAALYLAEKRQEQIDIMMEHKAPHCISDQHIKEVGLRGTRHCFSGTIYVHQGAKESNSYQKHNALLLDPTAFSAAQPNLEIFTDEVKASHGATVGQLNKEQLFYLTSRGLSKNDAQQLLVRAHLQEITHSITIPEAQKMAQKWMQ